MTLQAPPHDPRSSPRPSGFRAFVRRESGERGVVATEFALILPVMLLLFTGMLVYGTAIEINRKVTLTARNVTDLVTQYETLTTADLTMVMDSAAQVMAPFSLANATVVVSEVTVSAAGAATIVWSEALTGGTTITSPAAGYTPGTTVVIPASMVQSTALGLCPTTPVTANPPAGSCVIWGHVSYTYTPTIGYKVTGSIILADDMYMNPRLSSGVGINAAQTTP